MKMQREYKITFVLVSVCYLVLGLVLLLYPDFSARMFCYVLGGITILYGVSHIVTYFSRTDFADIYRLDLVTGLVLTGCGVYVMLKPDVVTTLLNLLIGLAICLDSLIKLQNALDLHRLGSRVWWSVLLLAAITGVLGIVLLFYKGTGFLSLMQFIGIVLVVDGCVNIWSFTFLTVNLSRLRRALRETEEQAQQGAQAVEPQPTELPPEEDVADETVKRGILDALRALAAKRKAMKETADESGAVVLKPDAEGRAATPEVAAAHGKTPSPENAEPSAEAEQAAAAQEAVPTADPAAPAPETATPGKEAAAASAAAPVADALNIPDPIK